MRRSRSIRLALAVAAVVVLPFATASAETVHVKCYDSGVSTAGLSPAAQRLLTLPDQAATHFRSSLYRKVEWWAPEEKQPPAGEHGLVSGQVYQTEQIVGAPNNCQ